MEESDLVFFFFGKTEYCVYLLIQFHSNTSSEGKKLNVSIAGSASHGERAVEKGGKRLQRKRAGKEGEGGIVTRSE